jgi:hypothetical protein
MFMTKLEDELIGKITVQDLKDARKRLLQKNPNLKKREMYQQIFDEVLRFWLEPVKIELKEIIKELEEIGNVAEWKGSSLEN